MYFPERLTEYRVHGGSATAKFQLKNSLGAAYVHGLIFRDEHFASIVDDMRPKCIGIEAHLVKLYARKLKLIPAIKHIVKAVRYRLE